MTTTARRPGPLAFRSLLFAPANHPRRVAKALEAGADVAVLDLEDAVAVAGKPAARAAAAEALAGPRSGAAYVRANGVATEWCWDDLKAVVGPGLDGLVLPKAECAEELRIVDWTLAQLERERGLPRGSVDLLPIVETARGILALEAIAAATPRVRRLAFGSADYSHDLGLGASPDEDELAFARARLVHCSRVAGLEAPVDSVVVEVRDAARFRAAAERGRRLGFQGKLCIHPDQVALANEAFAPTGREVERARAIDAAFAAAEAQGLASIEVDGAFVDHPVAAQARRVLALADRLGLGR